MKKLKVYGEKRKFFGLRKSLNFIAEVSVQDGKLIIETDNKKLRAFLEDGIKSRLDRNEMSFGRSVTERNPDGSGKHYHLVIKTDLNHPEFLMSIRAWLYELRNEDKIPFSIDPSLSKIGEK